MDTSKMKIPPRFVVTPPAPPGQKWHMVQHKKFTQNSLELKKKKKRMHRMRAMEKR